MSQMNKMMPAEKKYMQATSDGVASQMEGDEVIQNTMDQITAYCGNDCEDEVKEGSVTAMDYDLAMLEGRTYTIE